MLTDYSAKLLDDFCPTFAEWCTEWEQRAQEYERESPGASADAIELELGLLRLVEQGLVEEAAAELIAELCGNLTRGANQRQLSFVPDYIELLRILASGATHKKTSFRPQAPPLARIVEALKDWQAA